LAAVGLLTADAASAGTIHSVLAARLETMSPGDKVSAILVLTDQAPIEELSTSLSARKATRRERHREIVLALQEAAARSQGAIRERLDQLQSEGRVSGYTAYWIANIVVVHGDRPAIVELAARADVVQAELLQDRTDTAVRACRERAPGRRFRRSEGRARSQERDPMHSGGSSLVRVRRDRAGHGGRESRYWRGRRPSGAGRPVARSAQALAGSLARRARRGHHLSRRRLWPRNLR
jgi:hypothetical protein